jgi:20S proteasome alpha/beta subunit
MPLKPFQQTPLNQKVKRLREKRPRPMTLIAGFRASQGGVLLCSDRHEEDGVSKRAVNKIYRIPRLKSCEIFMAGAGPNAPVKNTFTEIHRAVMQRESAGGDVAWDHQKVIEDSLAAIHERYTDVLQTWPINLIIVVAPRGPQHNPMLYSTDGQMLSPEEPYVTHGSGKGIADYLSSRLYSENLVERWLVIFAAFVFREAGESSVGVGFGSNMVMIHNGRSDRWEIGHDAVKELEIGLPLLKECLDSHWLDADKCNCFPAWLNR